MSAGPNPVLASLVRSGPCNVPLVSRAFRSLRISDRFLRAATTSSGGLLSGGSFFGMGFAFALGFGCIIGCWPADDEEVFVFDAPVPGEAEGAELLLLLELLCVDFPSVGFLGGDVSM